MTQILAIDFGDKKIGLAMSDETQTIAGKLPVMFVKNQEEAIEGISILIKSMPTVSQVLLGIPLGENLEPTKQSLKVKSFAGKLKAKIDTKINIVFTNEILSSKEAEMGRSKKFKKEKSDSEAARIFLQEYLNHKNSNSQK